ncbi:MAG: 3-methyl-2-oxobutanoate hydroxymethyltransferase [Myxococcota bacterium]
MSRLTTTRITAMKADGDPIAMVTAYDATFARLMDEAGAEMLLVGDSLGMVFQGHDSTLPVTMDQMVYHTQAVVRGSEAAMVVADLPFLAYQVSVEDALRNGGRLMKEAGCQAVKLEGGERSVEAIGRLVESGIPVVAHLGLTPQSVHAFGGFRVQGREEGAAERLVADARAVQDAGAFCLVLEMVPAPLAKRVTEALEIPTIGIGAGVHCDGQVLVCYDFLGLTDDFSPRFLKRYDTLAERVREATRTYVREVKDRAFPTDEHSFS